MEYMTVQEAAHLLKVAPITIRRYITQGRLRAVKVGKAVRVKREALDELPQLIDPEPEERAPRKGRFLTFDDPLWGLVGVGSDEASDVSENKRKYLADAYERKGE